MLVAVYGTLRKGEGNYLALKMDEFTEFVETTVIQGTLFSLGGFPGIITGPNHKGSVVVDVFFLPEEHRDKMLARLDRLEGYNPNASNSDSNMYARKVTTTETGRMVFYYEWNWEPPENRLIPHGDWLKYKEDRHTVKGVEPKIEVIQEIPATIP